MTKEAFLSTVLEMCKIAHLAAGAPPQTPLGELTVTQCSPTLLAGFQGPTSKVKGKGREGEGRNREGKRE